MSDKPQVPQKKTYKKILIGFLIACIILILNASLSNRKTGTPSDNHTNSTDDRGLSPSKTDNERYKSEIDGYWVHTREIDPISKKTIHTATITSTFPLEFGFPYQGKQHAQLSIRRHPRYGLDVILQLEKGQFLAGVTGTTVNARFDENLVTKFSAVGPEDHDSKTLFLNNEAKFLTLLGKSKVVVLSTTVYQEGEQTMMFEVEKFDQSAFRNK
jgi:hypothetical protein